MKILPSTLTYIMNNNTKTGTITHSQMLGMKCNNAKENISEIMRSLNQYGIHG